MEKEEICVIKVGIICEYNPFHNGHLRQFAQIRARVGSDAAIVCLMSGNFVQRGDTAIFSKHDRAEAAVRCGADLVLELPLRCALSSAEGFADGGVRLLSRVGCDYLSFGTECGDGEALRRASELELSPDYDRLVRAHLAEGGSYASARGAALRELGAEAGISEPNDILGVEYCKAMLRRGVSMQPLPIARNGAYDAAKIVPEAPSASAVRAAIDKPALWLPAVPECLHALYQSAPRYSVRAGERAMLSRLRTLPDEAFAALPFGSEGLWSKLMRNCRACASVEEIVTATKSKRYAKTRIQRMLFCAFLGLTEEMMKQPPAYVRILAFNARGRSLIRSMREGFALLNSGEQAPPSDAAVLENRAADLYSLFSESPVAPGGAEARSRNRFLPSV